MFFQPFMMISIWKSWMEFNCYQYLCHAGSIIWSIKPIHVEIYWQLNQIAEIYFIKNF